MLAKKIFVAVVLLFFAGIAAFNYYTELNKEAEQDLIAEQTQEILAIALPQACEADINRFCGAEVIAKVRDCLKGHELALAKECQEALKDQP